MEKKEEILRVRNLDMLRRRDSGDDVCRAVTRWTSKLAL